MIVAVAACAGDEPSTSTDAPDDQEQASMADHDMQGHGGEFAFGNPADATDADRTIKIRTSNELAFDPAEVTVSEGETITFSISNEGDLPHDFVVGDEAAQDEHAAEMAEEMAEMSSEMEHGDANAVSVPPGETVELTWSFDGETEGLRYGCHEAGHYEAGMVGEIIVED